MSRPRPRPAWTGCSHPQGADRCTRPVHVTAVRALEGDRVRLCLECAGELEAAGMLVTASALRVTNG